ncbi:MAG: repressor LexA [Planctomycetes bacterium]|nr:repressor LexA [Planctomycetota bacterium]
MYFTEKQLRIMQFIQQFRKERGISPTLEEIADTFGVTKITIYEHINQLERKGALKREKFRARSIEILTPVEERSDRFSLPLVGRIDANGSVEEIDAAEDFSLSDFLPLGKSLIALRVQGDSLCHEHITDGDLVILEKHRDPCDGETVVVNLAGGASIKRYCNEGVGVQLRPINGSGTSVAVKDADICGVVVGVVRRFNGK